MILGNPYKFSIMTKTIHEWNTDEAFCNGILLFCVAGTIFPTEIVTATLKCEIQPLKEKLNNPAIDVKLYAIQKEKAFVEIYNLTFPENVDINNDYKFDISPDSFSDNNCFVFAVGNGEQVRIMAAKLNYLIKNSRHDLRRIDVSETFLDATEIKKIASELDIF